MTQRGCFSSAARTLIRCQATMQCTTLPNPVFMRPWRPGWHAFTRPAARHASEPRYALVVLRELVVRGRARRQRAFCGNEQSLDLLFPGARSNTRAKRDLPRLPDELFAIIARYWWDGGMSAEEKAAAAGEAAARIAAAESGGGAGGL